MAPALRDIPDFLGQKVSQQGTCEQTGNLVRQPLTTLPSSHGTLLMVTGLIAGLVLGKGGTVIKRPLCVNQWNECKGCVRQGLQGIQQSCASSTMSFQVPGNNGAAPTRPSRRSALPRTAHRFPVD